MESLNSNSQERELHQLQQMQDKAKESCMVSFRLLVNVTALFDQDVQTFTCSMLLNLDQLEQQLVKEEFHETGSMDAFRVFKTQFQKFINFRYYFDDFDESILERAKHKREKDRRVNDRMMQSKERKDNSSKALDAGLVVTESNETESERHVLSSRSGNDTYTDDADINSHLNRLWDTYLLEKVDRNTTPESTDMSHRGGEIDQNADAKKCQVSCSLPDPSFDNMKTEFSNQFLESKNISFKKTIAQLQKDFSGMETHYQYRLENSVAKLLAENKMLHKENEHLKQTYKDLYDSIKKTRVQTNNLNDSLVAQVNSKTIKNVNLKAQIQEKGFLRINQGFQEFNCQDEQGTMVVVIQDQTLWCLLIMASVDNTSGPVPQRKERCKLQCALSSKEEKSSCILKCLDRDRSDDNLLKKKAIEELGKVRLVVRHGIQNSYDQPETEGILPRISIVSVDVLRFYTSAGNPVKEILLKLNLPDHRKLKDGGEVKEFQRSFRHSDTERLSRSDEVLKLKNFKKDATLKLFKSTNQERYEHVGPKSQVSQDGKVH
ncbi:hypothetical protein Tco_1246715 [Tanacetum coccineum]